MGRSSTSLSGERAGSARALILTLQEQLTKWFNQVTGSDDAKKFLNGFASDPWIATPEEAQGAVRKEVEDWGRYMAIAKMEPQG